MIVDDLFSIVGEFNLILDHIFTNHKSTVTNLQTPQGGAGGRGEVP